MASWPDAPVFLALDGAATSDSRQRRMHALREGTKQVKAHRRKYPNCTFRLVSFERFDDYGHLLVASEPEGWVVWGSVGRDKRLNKLLATELEELASLPLNHATL